MGLIYLDTCLVIYACEDHPVHGARVREALAAAQEARFAVSPLVRKKRLVKPMREGNLVVQRHLEASLGHFAHLPMDDDTFGMATQLRAKFALKTPDALHPACAQVHACSALWTSDDRLARAAHGLAANVLT